MDNHLHTLNKFDLREMITEAPNNDLWVATLNNVEDSFCNRQWTAASTFMMYLRQGHLRGVINNQPCLIDAPSLIIIHKGDTFSLIDVSSPIHSSIIIMSERVSNRLQSLTHEYADTILPQLPAIAAVPHQYIPECEDMYLWLLGHIADANSPGYIPAAIFAILQFFFTTAYKFYLPHDDNGEENLGEKLAHKFVMLANHHHLEHRFLDYYADKLGISTKHLSRSVKRYTGLTAVRWIDIFTIIDAKILLATTTQSISEISEQLHFSSQSFFGKFFKKYTGCSPKEYRKTILNF